MWLVTLQVVIQAHATFYVAFLAAPILRSAISEGIISLSMWRCRCMLRLKKLTGLEFLLRQECLVFDSYIFLLLSGQ